MYTLARKKSSGKWRPLHISDDNKKWKRGGELVVGNRDLIKKSGHNALSRGKWQAREVRCKPWRTKVAPVNAGLDGIGSRESERIRKIKNEVLRKYQVSMREREYVILFSLSLSYSPCYVKSGGGKRFKRIG